MIPSGPLWDLGDLYGTFVGPRGPLGDQGDLYGTFTGPRGPLSDPKWTFSLCNLRIICGTFAGPLGTFAGPLGDLYGTFPPLWSRKGPLKVPQRSHSLFLSDSDLDALQKAIRRFIRTTTTPLLLILDNVWDWDLLHDLHILSASGVVSGVVTSRENIAQPGLLTIHIGKTVVNGDGWDAALQVGEAILASRVYNDPNVQTLPESVKVHPLWTKRQLFLLAFRARLLSLSTSTFWRVAVPKSFVGPTHPCFSRHV